MNTVLSTSNVATMTNFLMTLGYHRRDIDGPDGYRLFNSNGRVYAIFRVTADCVFDGLWTITVICSGIK